MQAEGLQRDRQGTCSSPYLLTPRHDFQIILHMAPPLMWMVTRNKDITAEYTEDALYRACGGLWQRAYPDRG
jgi:hypothetical protein